MKILTYLKYCLCLVGLFFSALALSAQSDTTTASVKAPDLFSEIITQTDSNTIFISNGRALLIKDIVAGNCQHSGVVFDSLRSKFDAKKYVILYPDEEQLLFFLSKQKQPFFNSLCNEVFNDTLTMPLSDNLYDVSFNYLQTNLDEYIGWIDSSEMTLEEKSIAHFYIAKLGLYNDKPALLTDVRKFRKNYPQSKFTPFVKPLQTKFSDISLGISLGAGGMDLRGKVTDVASVSGLFSMEMNCFYNRLYTSFFLSASLKGLLKNDMQDVDSAGDVLYYDKGNSVTYLSCGLRFGYLLYRNSWLKMYPYASFLGSETYAPYSNDDEISLTLSSGAGLGAGVGFDIDLLKWGDTGSIEASPNHLGLRLNGGAEKNFAEKSYPDASALYFSAALVWWIGD